MADVINRVCVLRNPLLQFHLQRVVVANAGKLRLTRSAKEREGLVRKRADTVPEQRQRRVRRPIRGEMARLIADIGGLGHQVGSKCALHREAVVHRVRRFDV